MPGIALYNDPVVKKVIRLKGNLKPQDPPFQLFLPWKHSIKHDIIVVVAVVFAFVITHLKQFKAWVKGV